MPDTKAQIENENQETSSSNIDYDANKSLFCEAIKHNLSLTLDTAHKNTTRTSSILKDFNEELSFDPAAHSSFVKMFESIDKKGILQSIPSIGSKNYLITSFIARYSVPEANKDKRVDICGVFESKVTNHSSLKGVVKNFSSLDSNILASRLDEFSETNKFSKFLDKYNQSKTPAEVPAIESQLADAPDDPLQSKRKLDEVFTLQNDGDLTKSQRSEMKRFHQLVKGGTVPITMFIDKSKRTCGQEDGHCEKETKRRKDSIGKEFQL